VCYSLVILAGCILIQMGPDILVNSASRTQPSGTAGTMRRRSLVGSLEDKLKGSRVPLACDKLAELPNGIGKRSGAER
jgi:hypothetical protein